MGELERWNARFNLISRRDIGRVWPRHVLDSLSVVPAITAADPAVSRGVDIGTGAGLPGLPLAIALPRIHWLLVDRNQRKIRFLDTVIAALGLTNVEAVVLDPGKGIPGSLAAKMDLVVSRAVDEPDALIRLSRGFLSDHGRLVLMTGAAGAQSESLDDGDAAEDAADDAVTDGTADGRRGAGREPGATRTVTEPGFVVASVQELVIPGLDRTHEVTIIVRVAPYA